MEPVALNCEMVRSLFYMMSNRLKFREAILSFSISHRTALYTASFYACKNVFFLFQNGRLTLRSKQYATYKNDPFIGIFKRFVKKAAVYFDSKMDLDFVLRCLKDMDNLSELFIFTNDPKAFWKMVEANNKFYILFLNVELLRKLKQVSSDDVPNVLSVRLVGTPVEGCVKLVYEIFPCLRHLAFCREKRIFKGFRQYVVMNQVVGPGMSPALIHRMMETGEAPELQFSKPKNDSWPGTCTVVTLFVLMGASLVILCYLLFWLVYESGLDWPTIIFGPEL